MRLFKQTQKSKSDNDSSIKNQHNVEDFRRLARRLSDSMVDGVADDEITYRCNSLNKCDLTNVLSGVDTHNDNCNGQS